MAGYKDGSGTGKQQHIEAEAESGKRTEHYSEFGKKLNVKEGPNVMRDCDQYVVAVIRILSRQYSGAGTLNVTDGKTVMMIMMNSLRCGLSRIRKQYSLHYGVKI